jgi:hypothetical protein
MGLHVEYRQSPALNADECRRRIRLAYAYVLGIVPWPEEHAAASGLATHVPHPRRPGAEEQLVPGEQVEARQIGNEGGA